MVLLAMVNYTRLIYSEISNIYKYLDVQYTNVPNIRVCYRMEILDGELERLKDLATHERPLTGMKVTVQTVGEAPVVNHEDVHSVYFINHALKLRSEYAFEPKNKYQVIVNPDDLSHSGVFQI